MYLISVQHNKKTYRTICFSIDRAIEFAEKIIKEIESSIVHVSEVELKSTTANCHSYKPSERPNSSHFIVRKN